MNTELIENGYRVVGAINAPDEIQALQEEIYGRIQTYLTPHDETLPLVERLSLPFDKPISISEWGKFSKAVENSDAMRALSTAPAVYDVFREIFHGPPQLHPICRFRARIPGLNATEYGWHQDHGIIYTHKHPTISDRLASALWISLNGAEKGTGIQLIPGSHHGRLRRHKFKKGQGAFGGVFDSELEQQPPFEFEAPVGHGILFHPLIIHRTSPGTIQKPRFSVDIRYFDPEGDDRINVEFRFRVERALKRLIP